MRDAIGGKVPTGRGLSNEFNNINFSLENLTSKLECLKMIERKYNESISDEILLLIKDLKMLHSDYLRDKEEELFI